MSAACPSIADRHDCGDIDAALDAGASLRSIALTYGVSKTTLIRYRDGRQTAPAAERVVRVRSRARPLTPEPAPCAAHESEHLPPTQAKLREVAKLLAQGFSREEIAARYRVGLGTVTDWHRRIREDGIALVQAVTAENVVATLLTNMEQRSAMLWRIASRAEGSAPRVAIAALDGLRKEDQHVAAMADTLGILNRFEAAKKLYDDRDTLAADAIEFSRQISGLLREGISVAELFGSERPNRTFPSGPDQRSEVDHLDQTKSR